MIKKKYKNHVKVGEKIQIISGKFKGLLGNITSINKEKNLVIIDTILPRIKYVKNSVDGKSKKIELQIPIHISNVKQNNL
jgi:large subunit ribosomal protein L24